jgi:hypothetical protein
MENKIVVNISDTKYPVVPYVTKKLLGWVTSKKDDENWTVWWTDGAVSIEKLMRMKPY